MYMYFSVLATELNCYIVILFEFIELAKTATLLMLEIHTADDADSFAKPLLVSNTA